MRQNVAAKERSELQIESMPKQIGSITDAFIDRGKNKKFLTSTYSTEREYRFFCRCLFI